MIEYDKGDIVKVIKEDSPHKDCTGIVLEVQCYERCDSLVVFFEVNDNGIWRDLFYFKDVDVELVQRSSHVDFYMYSKRIMEELK